MRIVGITGTPGAGKGTVVAYLVNQYGFNHYSARAWISKQLTKRGLPLSRENMRLVANNIRAENGPSFIIERLYEKAVADGSDAVIESLRNPKEIEALRFKPGKFTMLAVDADPKIRYERILRRKSSTDNVSFKKFLEDEQAEMNDTSPGGLRIAECIQISDYILNNNGDVEALYNQVDDLMEKFQ